MIFCPHNGQVSRPRPNAHHSCCILYVSNMYTLWLTLSKSHLLVPVCLNQGVPCWTVIAARQGSQQATWGRKGHPAALQLWLGINNGRGRIVGQRKRHRLSPPPFNCRFLVRFPISAQEGSSLCSFLMPNKARHTPQHLLKYNFKAFILTTYIHTIYTILVTSAVLVKILWFSSSNEGIFWSCSLLLQ